MSFYGKVILITGASSGIGEATARHFATLEAKLSLIGRKIEALKKVEEDIKSTSHAETFVVTGDLTKDEDVKNIVEATVNHYGQIDVLINNAGIMTKGLFEDAKIEDFDNLFQINVRSVFLLTNLALPYLIKTKGNIINISSTSGMKPYATFSIYCMSKSAIDQFTKCIALELAPKGVRVNSINPGYIKTNLHRRGGIFKNTEEEGAYVEASTKRNPSGKIGTVEDVAKAIAYIASDDAAFITGTNTVIDGGRILQ